MVKSNQHVQGAGIPTLIYYEEGIVIMNKIIISIQIRLNSLYFIFYSCNIWEL